MILIPATNAEVNIIVKLRQWRTCVRNVPIFYTAIRIANIISKMGDAQNAFGTEIPQSI